MSLPGSRRTLPLFFAAAALAITCAGPRVHAQRKFDEREIKATFLFNFAQFVDWPQASFADSQAPLVIGVLGADPFNTALDAVVRGETVKGRTLVITRFRRVEDVTVCHMLFVSPSESPRSAKIAEVLHGRAVLTVGDTDEFSTHGGMIRFVNDRNRVKLRINLGEARAAGLTISSQLLRAAEVVGGGEDR